MAKTGTYALIASNTLGSASGTVTFSSIPSTFTDLILVVNGIATSGALTSISLQFNADTSNSYSGTRLSGDGTSASSDRYSSAGVMGGGVISGTAQGNDIIHIQDYANSTTYKTVLFRANVANAIVRTSVNTWLKTNAITQIDVYSSATTFASGSTFYLYGIEAGNA